MDLIYLAHPVRPRPDCDETVESNLASAEWWLLHLQRANPEAAFIAPWLQSLRLGVDDDRKPLLRRQGLNRARAGVKACAAIAVCGTHIGAGSLEETCALREGGVIHRFRSRNQRLTLPPTSSALIVSEWDLPIFMSSYRYGVFASSAEETARELVDAWERFAEEVLS